MQVSFVQVNLIHHYLMLTKKQIKDMLVIYCVRFFSFVKTGMSKSILSSIPHADNKDKDRRLVVRCCYFHVSLFSHTHFHTIPHADKNKD